MPVEEVFQGEKATLPQPPPLPRAGEPPGLPPGVCANCASPLTGPYCALCGQHVADYHRSVWRLVAGFFDNAFCWDNKLFRTLGPLVARPGLLTQEFMAGRRVRYVHPLRLFLFTSAVCLTLLQIGHLRTVKIDTSSNKDGAGKPGFHFHIRDRDDDEDDKPSPAPSPAVSPAPPAAPASSVAPAPSAASPAPSTADADGDLGKSIREEITKEVRGDRGKHDPGWADSFARQLGRKVEKRVNEVGKEKFGQEITDGVQQRLSWITLAMLPLFALLLRSLYWRRDSYYFGSLIFSLHYHTFLLLFWTAYTWVDTLAAFTHFGLFEAAVGLCLLAPPWYLYVALRRLYGDSRRRTATKVIVLGALHLLALIIGLSIVGMLSFMKTMQG